MLRQTHKTAEILSIIDAEQPKSRKSKAKPAVDRVMARTKIGFKHQCWPCDLSRKTTSGYAQVSDINPNTGKATMRHAHVVVWEAANGRAPTPGMQICHKDWDCSKVSCCNPGHLREDTPSNNYKDAVRDGRVKGRKLTGDKARKIVVLHNEHFVDKDALAERFGVSLTTIRNVLSAKHWSGDTGLTPKARCNPGRPKRGQEKPHVRKITNAMMKAAA